MKRKKRSLLRNNEEKIGKVKEEKGEGQVDRNRILWKSN